jgi:hypothetical protein
MAAPLFPASDSVTPSSPIRWLALWLALIGLLVLGALLYRHAERHGFAAGREAGLRQAGTRVVVIGENRVRVYEPGGPVWTLQNPGLRAAAATVTAPAMECRVLTSENR